MMKNQIYFAKSKSDKTRFESTSGGIFFELAKYIIDCGGYVAGATFDKNLKLKHFLVNSLDELHLIQKSKYVEAKAYNVYIEIKQKLVDEKLVLFSGTPCQVSALKSFLNKDYKNLITMDFICRGVNSNKAFNSWIKEIESKNKANVDNVWFKYKIGGWKSSPMRTRVDFSNGTYKVYEGFDNLYMYGYLFQNLYLRPCCTKCRFKGSDRSSDVTVGDFWGLQRELDDDKGTSFVMLNTEKGEQIFASIEKNIISGIAENSTFASNPMFSSNVERSIKSNKFLALLDNYKFSKALKIVDAFPKKNRILKFLVKIKKGILRNGKK